MLCCVQVPCSDVGVMSNSVVVKSLTAVPVVETFTASLSAGQLLRTLNHHDRVTSWLAGSTMSGEMRYSSTL